MSQNERYDFANNYELIEHAMTLWRWGELGLERLPWMVGEHRAQYERAIVAGVAWLRQFETMEPIFRSGW